MTQCLVIALNLEKGYHIGGMGGDCTGVTIPDDAVINYHDYDFADDDDPLDKYKVVSCIPANAEVVAHRMAMNNPGMNVGVFQLTSIFISPPSDVIKKVVSKEGILPF